MRINWTELKTLHKNKKISKGRPWRLFTKTKKISKGRPWQTVANKQTMITNQTKPGSWYNDPTHTHTQHTHTHTHTHTHIHTHTHTHTPHYNMFVHTTLIQPNLYQRRAETSELIGRISSSELDPQPCVVLLCVILLCSSAFVRMYVSMCSFALFSFALLAGGRCF